MVKGQRRWLGFYGDDFTGSTDAMEALTRNGVKTILFLQPPTESMLTDERFAAFKAIGLAGVSRALSPEKMENELTHAFDILKKANVEISHYKICSTFDSSPELGSIGRAIEVGQKVFGNKRFIPLLVGVPALHRYTIFSNHFATTENETYRLDRHPVMSKHPMTPMDESDLTIHLGKQTSMAIKAMNILDLDGPQEKINKILATKLNGGHSPIILFDVLDEAMLTNIGVILSEEISDEPFFTVGSSGIEYSLAAAWKESGRLEEGDPQWPRLEESGPLMVISGSCSPVTEKQIQYALNNGFVGLKASSEGLTNSETRDEVCHHLILKATDHLSKGENVVIYTAMGPSDPSITSTKKQLEDQGQKATDTSMSLGEQLGKICKEIMKEISLKRVLIAGGDTSGYVLKELEIFAMEMVKPITPGAPLCRAHSRSPLFNGMQINLKGGQMGGEDFFLNVRNLT
ncbi:four-carbon acid sugar kinase family protein [Mesobacillus foraminis]|uniref:four-carbon acid sugar kinase family protein n=1 Tax=Mesobacillus foraminis TaxID=279826 RepID=UPI001BE72565|nr:four-carbon acid sugar kinase family protein [Mesobacillus foraminis]MBT2757803.1 four-carbon acid sugar kinase family protein [Mesobacillus foraminis]